MTKSLRWRIPLIAVVIAIGLMVLYPPADKVLKREVVKEVDGKVVESTTLESSWTRIFVTNPVIRETIIREEKGLYALLATCTHLGCTPNWIKANNRFQCPCHGGVYTKEGDVVAGPPPAPLYRAAISLGPTGEIMVDKGFQENRPGLRDKEPFFIKV